MNLVCTSCIQAAEDITWSAGIGDEPADLCMSLGAQMNAHDCLAGAAPSPCACVYPHDGRLGGNDPIRVLELGRQYARAHGYNAIAAEGMHRAICRALTLLEKATPTDRIPSTGGLWAIYDGLQTHKEPNTRNLNGIRCPKCGSYEPFDITMEITYTTYDHTPSQPRTSRAWTLDSDIKCNTCGHSGIVGEFQQNLTAGEIMRLEGKEGKGRTTGINLSRDFGMSTSEGNEAVSKLVDCALRAIEGGRRSGEVHTLLSTTIQLIRDHHPEISSITVSDHICNALAPAYRKRYGVGLPYGAIQWSAIMKASQ